MQNAQHVKKLIRHVSAPGKVLLTGGYLILDRQYSGLVAGIESRMHCVISNNKTLNTIRVQSPQFVNGNWSFKYDNGSVDEIAGSNKFVQITLSVVFRYLEGMNCKINSGIDIEFNADNDFYSQGSYLRNLTLEPTMENIKAIPKFNFTNCEISKVNKTGLGTSATLVTTLVAGLLIHNDLIKNDEFTKSDLVLIDKIAQVCHSLAQGKIGSGFDVSSACFGSHLYTRFSPDLISPVLESPKDVDVISKCIDQEWDQNVVQQSLPNGIYILLAEVHQGSNTPQMVSKVLQWRNEDEILSTKVWNEINVCQQKIIAQFDKLRGLERNPNYENEMNNIGNSKILEMVEDSDIIKSMQAIAIAGIV